MTSPEESSHFAFQELVLLARIDRRIGPEEQRTLDRFARHLGITSFKARRYLRVCRRRTLDFPADPARQLDLLRMLARIAYADGELQEQEQRFFDALASDFGVSRTRLARVLEEAEADAHQSQRVDRRWWFSLLGGALIVGLLAWLWTREEPPAADKFRGVDAQVRASLLLVHTRYVLEHDDLPARRFSDTGTGFFVSANGHVATNKHVLQPWRFVGAAHDLLAKGYRVREGSVATYVWREGERVQTPGDGLDLVAAYSTRRGTLQVVGFAPDRDLTMAARPQRLRVPGLFLHANDDGDLALLRCRGVAGSSCVELAQSSEQVTRLDEVMVLGYPRGLKLLERGRAVSSPTVGRVRKAERTIYVSAPIVGGNSGGPLVDTEGRVVGVATRVAGDSTLGGCLRVERVRELLDRLR